MVDILLATYNGEKFIRQQLDSIINQSFKNWNLIIQDDASSDHTLDILLEYQEKYPKKIKVFTKKNNTGSPSHNFFSLINFSKNDYVMFSDQDDIWLPNKIKLTLDNMIKAEKKYDKNTPLLVHTDLKVVDENLNIINDSLFKYQNMNCNRDKINNLLAQNIVTGCTTMINKSLINLIDKKIMVDQNIIMYDWFLALMACAFGKIIFVPKQTILYRQHKSNQVGAKKVTTFKFMINKICNLKKLKLSIKDTYNQAKSFLEIYQKKLDKKNFELITQYIKIKDNNKFNKIKILFKYKFFKYGTLRKLGQILFS